MPSSIFYVELQKLVGTDDFGWTPYREEDASNQTQWTSCHSWDLLWEQLWKFEDGIPRTFLCESHEYIYIVVESQLVCNLQKLL